MRRNYRKGCLNQSAPNGKIFTMIVLPSKPLESHRWSFSWQKKASNPVWDLCQNIPKLVPKQDCSLTGTCVLATAQGPQLLHVSAQTDLHSIPGIPMP